MTHFFLDGLTRFPFLDTNRKGILDVQQASHRRLVDAATLVCTLTTSTYYILLASTYHSAGPGLTPDLTSIISRAELTGRVEEGLARAGIQTLKDFELIRDEADLISLTGLPGLPARKLWAAVKGGSKPPPEQPRSPPQQQTPQSQSPQQAAAAGSPAKAKRKCALHEMRNRNESHLVER